MAAALKPTRRVLEQRLAVLEESHRQTRDALELAATLGVADGAHALTTPLKILTETTLRVRKLLRFKVLAFFLVREPGGEFYLAHCHPPSRTRLMEEHMHRMVESGSAAWALQRTRPVFSPALKPEGPLLLYPMATAARIRGIALGWLDQDMQSITDTSLSLLAIVLRSAASLLEGVELYTLLRKTNADLRTRVRDLENARHTLEREITRRVKVEAALTHQALHDPLTALPNRTLIHDRILLAIRRSQSKEDFHYAVVFMDLDRFKLVNDTFGHAAGDTLLVMVSRRICETLRRADTVARFGGDEFILCLEDLEGPRQAVRTLKRLRLALARPFAIDGHQLMITGSFGLVFGPTAPKRPPRPDSLIKSANVAMHAAKEGGRNRIKVFTNAMSKAARQQAALLRDLKKALLSGQTGALFVPLPSGNAGAIGGFEVTPSWTNPARGCLQGQELAALAEEAGVGVELGQRTFALACARLARWREAHLPAKTFVLALRPTRSQMAQADFATATLAQLDKAGLPPATLRLEIPEDALLSGGEFLLSMLTQLKGSGVDLCAGEFGERFFAFHAGHKDLIDSIRLDSARMAAAAQSHRGEILASLAAMARALGISVLSNSAEAGGTELPAEPMTPEEVETMLEGEGRERERGRGTF